MKHIASVSFGKDSLAMLLMLIEKEYPLDEVVFYDTGMEFQAIYDTRDAVLPLLVEKGIAYIELYPPRPFLYDMLEKPIKYRDKEGYHLGFSWCGLCGVRWGTREKLTALARHEKSAGEPVVWYVGIAADEPKRLERLADNKRAPLAEWNISEAQALQFCYDKGFSWRENGKRLYDYFDRVSCWCCGYINLRALKNMHQYFPEYWQRLKDLQSHTDRPMKGPGKSVFDLEKRFAEEIAAEQMQMKIV